MKIPESMYGKGPQNDPAPEKSWETSDSRAYGDAGIRMLETKEYAPELAKNQYEDCCVIDINIKRR